MSDLRIYFVFLYCAIIATATQAEERNVDPTVLNDYRLATVEQYASARQLLNQGKTDAAFLEYMDLINRKFDSLLPYPNENGLYHPAGKLVPFQLTRSSAMRVRYQQKVDPLAKQWLEKGQKTRAQHLLKRIILKASFSSHSASAWNILGDLYFARGRLAEAEYAWMMAMGTERYLLTLTTDKDNQLDNNDPIEQLQSNYLKSQRADIQAKILLSKWYRGRREEFQRDIEIFSIRFPDSAGMLAGKQGKYVSLLRAISQERVSLPVRREWKMKNCLPDRNRVVHTASDILDRRLKKKWSFTIPAKDYKQQRTFDYSPLCIGDKVFVYDGKVIWAIDKQSGQYQLWYRNERAMKDTALCSMTKVQNRLLICQEQFNKMSKVREAYLVCVDGKNKGKIHWRKAISPLFNSTASICSDPLVVGELVYLAVEIPKEHETIAVVCLNRHHGRLVWLRLIGHAEQKQAHHSSVYLTHAGQAIIYHGWPGITVALDKDRGDLHWARVWPNRIAAPVHDINKKDQLSCIYSDGRLYLSDQKFRINCLNAFDGRQIWQSAEVSIQDIVGIRDRILVIVTAEDIRALDVDSGRICWRQPAIGQITTLGESIILHKLILWPSQYGNQILHLDTGKPALDPQQLQHLPVGNLVTDDKNWILGTNKQIEYYQ